MTDRDRIFLKTYNKGAFLFNEEVANVFDDMINRSIPFYEDIQGIQADIIMDVLSGGASIICDLGCSTGTTIKRIAQHSACTDNVEFIGFDCSEAMLTRAQKKLAEFLVQSRFRLHNEDISQLDCFPKCNAIILNWVLQFIPPVKRSKLIKKCFEALRSGGVLLLSEKVLCDQEQLNQLYVNHHLQFKRTYGGYTDKEIQRKRQSLENVLIPYSLDQNLLLLRHAGFRIIDTYYRWLNFACMIAIKK